MTLQDLLSQLGELRLPSLFGLPPMFTAALLAMLVTTLGSLLARPLPRIGRVLRTGGNLSLAAVLVLTVLQVMRIDPRFDGVAPRLGLQAQTVVGEETRVRLSPDGHYWIEADVNGTRHRFLVDTGASLTALSADTARASRVEPDELRMPVMVRTAQGAMQAQMATIDELKFGNIVARDLDAIVTGATGGLNVVGMNFLSRLHGWRVEEGVLVLTPKNPQPPAK